MPGRSACNLSSALRLLRSQKYEPSRPPFRRQAGSRGNSSGDFPFQLAVRQFFIPLRSRHQYYTLLQLAVQSTPLSGCTFTPTCMGKSSFAVALHAALRNMPNDALRDLRELPNNPRNCDVITNKIAQSSILDFLGFPSCR